MDKSEKGIMKLEKKIGIFHKSIKEFIPEKNKKVNIPETYFEIKESDNDDN